MKVLCIEDDRFIGEMYVRSLQRAGYDVDWITDGQAGLDAATSKPYDIILVDIMLPNKKGDDIIEALRGGKEDLVPQSKIVVMTNYQQDAQERISLEEKVDAYIIKADITPTKLVNALNQIIGKNRV